MKIGFRALRKHADDLVLFVEMMQQGSDLPCLSGGPATITALRQRFQPYLTDTEADTLMDTLINKSMGSIWTRLYDQFQTLSQGIL